MIDGGGPTNATLRVRARFGLVFCLFFVPVLVAAEGYVEGRAAYVAGDYAAAQAIWRLAAEAGDMRAEFALGTLYESGQGVDKNSYLATFWFQRSAEAGFAPAQYNLGNAYLHGSGVPRDDIEAARWWRLAAEQDFVSAQFNLANHYYNGRGVTRDVDEALHWYRRAAQNGHQRAEEIYQSLAAGSVVETSPQSEASVTERSSIASAIAPAAEADEESEAVLVPSDQGQPALHPTSPLASQLGEQKTAESDRAMPVVIPADVSETRAETTGQETRQSSATDPAPVMVDHRTPAAGLRDEAWLLRQPPTHYTLQLAAMSDKAGIERFIERHRLRGDLAYFAFDRDGRTLYALVYGHYADLNAAKAGIDRLPGSLQPSTPWVRRIGVIQSLIGAE